MKRSAAPGKGLGKSGGLGLGARPASRKAASNAPIQAMQLLGRWTRVAQGHIAYGGSCSCCTADLGNLQAKDMEQHILDYLDSKYRNAGSPEVCHLLAERAGHVQGKSGSIAELLRALAMQGETSIPEKHQLAILDDLGRSIESLDEAMRGAA
jgi:hypothetical protein